MNIVFLNGEFMPLSEAKISPMDRGFLFGEGIYEVIPCHHNRFVGWQAHMDRMFGGLNELEIPERYSAQQLREFAQQLVANLPETHQGVYIHITRGAEEKRYHAYDNTGTPTVFMMNYGVPPIPEPDRHETVGLSLKLEQDARWHNCHIKSTALIGNVLHFQSAYADKKQETLLFDVNHFLTEASTSNVFFVKGCDVITPPLSKGLLPGVTRKLLINILKQHTSFKVKEEKVPVSALYDFDEIWLTSSSKGVVPVSDIDGRVIGNGTPGLGWLQAATAYSEYCFDD